MPGLIFVKLAARISAPVATLPFFALERPFTSFSFLRRREFLWISRVTQLGSLVKRCIGYIPGATRIKDKNGPVS